MMTGARVARKQIVQCRTKVKTGCATCRIRKVKCDEGKPFCKKCVGTGRSCDGYESPFRSFTIPFVVLAPAGGITPGSVLHSVQPTSLETTPQDVELLGRYFSTKTLFDVNLGCNEEARQVLQASMNSAALRHAVSSLRALRADLEMHGDVLAPVVQQTSSYNYGLQQYCMALGGLAADLSDPGTNRLKSALLCCQMFISIEQVQGNYAGMARHLIQGLRVMDQCRARPRLISANVLVPAYHDQLPLLDNFIIKLFTAPCKFAEPAGTFHLNETAVAKCPISPPQEHVGSRDLRSIVPDRRVDLTRIATRTMRFLGKVSRVESSGDALRLLSEKDHLSDDLARWLMDLELGHELRAPQGPEPISITFMRLFHQVLKIILIGSLDSSPGLYTNLITEGDRLLGIAGRVDERLQRLRTMKVG